jgi:hypothetical protein
MYSVETWTLQKVDLKYVHGKLGNVMLEKDGDQLDRSCEK